VPCSEAGANILGRSSLCNVNAWEIHVKGASPSRLSLDFDVPTVLLGDAIDRRQAESCTFACLLRREEGLEDMVDHIGSNA
jgi:hypothetical protein